MDVIRATDATSTPPPRLRWPALAQSLVAFLWMDRFAYYLLRRSDSLLTLRLVGIGEVVVVSSPDAVKEVFTADREIIRAGEANARVLPVIGEKSVLALDGEPHLRARRLLSPPFHGDSVRRYTEVVEEIATAEVERWPVGEEFAALPRMQAIALEVIMRAVIGVREEHRRERLRAMLPRLLGASPPTFLVEGRYPWIAKGWIGRLRPWVRARHEVERLIHEEIAAHRADPADRDDILALLMSARDEAGAPLSDQELHDQLLTLLLAGHETTAASLAWCFERLLRHPDTLAQVQRELDDGEGDALLEAVVNETLRVRPVIEVVWRKLAAPFELAGYRLPAGTIIAPSIPGVQRRGAFADPDEFRPERFLEGSAPPYTLIPFGGGARHCVGANFAVMEMKTVLRVVLERAELCAPRSKPERVSRMRRFTNVPVRGARVIVSARRAAPGA